MLRAGYASWVLVQNPAAKGKSLDTVTVCSLLLTAAGFFAAIMLFDFLFRCLPPAYGGFDNATFASLLFSFPMVVMFVCQSLNGPALAWLGTTTSCNSI